MIKKIKISILYLLFVTISSIVYPQGEQEEQKIIELNVSSNLKKLQLDDLSSQCVYMDEKDSLRLKNGSGYFYLYVYKSAKKANLKGKYLLSKESLNDILALQQIEGYVFRYNLYTLKGQGILHEIYNNGELESSVKSGKKSKVRKPDYK